jgi:hypothetical protein
LAPGASGGCGQAASNIAAIPQTALAATSLTPWAPRFADEFISSRR